MNSRRMFIVCMLLFSFITIKAESKDVIAKYEYIKSNSAFYNNLESNFIANINDNQININSDLSDVGKEIVIVPSNVKQLMENFIGKSDNYEGYYVDFYDSNNNNVNIENPITFSSVTGNNYNDAFITVISSSGEILYEGDIKNNEFSFLLNNRAYIVLDYDISRNGDINIDHLVNINDLILLRKHLAGIKLLTAKRLKLSDVNKDIKVNINDLIKLRKYLAGMEEL